MNSPRFSQLRGWFAVALISLGGASAVFAQEGIIDLPPQTIMPPMGFSVFPGPDTSLKPLKVVMAGDDYQEISAVGYRKTAEGRLFLTAEGLRKIQGGGQAEWIYIPGVSDLPEFRFAGEGGVVENSFELFDRHEYSRALPSLIREYEAIKNGPDWSSSTTREAYNLLFGIGWSFANLGDLSQAETALLWHADVAENHWGPFDRRGGLVPKSNLCEFYRTIGNVGKEMRLRQEAFELHAAGYDLDEGNEQPAGPAVASYQHALTLLKQDVVDFAGNEQIEAYRMFLEMVRLSVRHGLDRDAERFTRELKEVIDCIDLASDGSGKRLHAEGLLLLAEWALRQKKPGEAARLITVAKTNVELDSDEEVELFSDWTSIRARVALANGDAGTAIRLLEPALSKAGFTHSLPLRQLLQAAYHDAGRSDDLKRLTAELSQLQAERTRQVLEFSSEEQRVRFMKQLRPLGGWLETGTTEGIARAALRFKGLTLDAALEQSASRLVAVDPKVHALQRQLGKYRQEAHVALRSMESADRGGDMQTVAADFQRAAAEIDRLESLLARELPSTGLVRDALGREPQEIVRGLQEDRCIIDFVLGDRHLSGLEYEQVYVAIRYTSRGITTRVCGTAADVDRRVAALRSLIERPQTPDEVLRQSLAEVHALLFGDFLNERGQGTTLLLSPDGGLNFLPFAALMDARGEPLVANFDVGFITSAREGLAPVKPWKVDKALLIGNPSYDASIGDAVAKQRVSTRSGIDFGQLRFADLPGAEAETRMIDARLKAANRQSSLVTGASATENAFRTAAQADLIHIATHGALFKAAGLPGEEQIVLGQMAHGIVAFAGANSTLANWGRGWGAAPDDDGIVSADEFALMDLGGVQGMVLSACETGLGGNVAGEGVMGLRRGIHQAGVADLVSTLWAIDDAATVAVMQGFYDRILKNGESPLRALASTQRELMAAWSREISLAAAVNRATPFVISISRGRPERRASRFSETLDSAAAVPESRAGFSTGTTEHPDSAADKVRQFVRAKIGAESQQDLVTVIRCYGAEVNYFRDGWLDADEILQIKRTYFTRFPQTSEAIQGEISAAREGDRWRTRFTTKFRAVNAKGDIGFDGVQASTLLIEDQGGSYVIVEESSEILSGTQTKNGVIQKRLGQPRQEADGAAPQPAEALEGERYPATRLRMLTLDDVASLGFAEVRYAINEMFARHGAPFPKAEIRAAFSDYSWYKAREGLAFDEIEARFFSPLERANLKVLGEHRDRVRR